MHTVLYLLVATFLCLDSLSANPVFTGSQTREQKLKNGSDNHNATSMTSYYFYYYKGTAPFCGASCHDCEVNKDDCVEEYKGNCWTGRKVKCGRKDYPNKWWIGTAPFCSADCKADCEREYRGTCLNWDSTGDGATCNGGDKVLCGSVYAGLYWVGEGTPCTAGYGSGEVDCGNDILVRTDTLACTPGSGGTGMRFLCGVRWTTQQEMQANEQSFSQAQKDQVQELIAPLTSEQEKEAMKRRFSHFNQVMTMKEHMKGIKNRNSSTLPFLSNK